jgi:hypothetical protein
MKHIYIKILVLFLTSCSINKEQNRFLDSIEISSRIHNKKLDLSNMSLDRIPNLSVYDIEEVNLSNNKIKKFEEKLFSKKIKKINLMNNKISGFVVIDSLGLENLNISRNKIEKIYINNFIIKNLNISNNKLLLVQMPLLSSNNTDLMGDTLNISNNKRLDNFVSFMPSVYKNIIRDNIKNNNPLFFVLDKPLK